MLSHKRGILQEGRFGWAGMNGMSLTEGIFWARRSGGYNFYFSDKSLSEIDFRWPMAACGSDVHRIELEGIFEANRDYWIAVKTISGFGWESDSYEYVHSYTDENVDGKEVPEPVSNLKAGIENGTGAIELQWDYEPAASRVRPTEFVIYMLSDDGNGNDDYVAVGSVEYSEGRVRYVWVGNNLSLFNVYRLIVRARTGEGIEDGNGRYVIARGNGISPGSVDSVEASLV